MSKVGSTERESQKSWFSDNLGRQSPLKRDQPIHFNGGEIVPEGFPPFLSENQKFLWLVPKRQSSVGSLQ